MTTSSSSPVAMYRSFLLSNASQITSIEQAIRSLCYFLPGRFTDADLASESLFAFVNLISLYHDHVLLEATQRTNIPNYKPSLLTQYHKFWHSKSSIIRWSSVSLTVLQNVESVCELIATKSSSRSNRRRWNVIVTIEALKVFLRLLIVAKTKQISISPCMPERECDPELVATTLANSQSYIGQRSKITFPSIDAMGDSAHSLWDNYLSNQAVKSSFINPAFILSKLNLSRSIGEFLFILRPLVYAFLLRKHGMQSWRPLLSSFLVELAAYLFLVRRVQKSQLSSLEQNELFSRRAYLFLWYLLRGPVYTKFTKRALDSFCRAMHDKPVLNLFSGLIRNYQPLWEGVYFYTSGS